jgi:ABC-type polysaccharide/polyol phosphate transport system ATPase subunit
MRVTPGKSRVRESRMPGSVRAKPNGLATRPSPLQVARLHAYHGKSHILQGVDLAVGEREIVSLLGRNGAGRSTACKAVMGLIAADGVIAYRAGASWACGPTK